MTLELAIEGCCKGHKCDNCATCRKGRCCRRDNPDYKLPALGEWDGPIYGEPGVLKDDGEKVECHCCGEWYRHIGIHAWKAHDLTPAEYRSIFGFNRKQGLVSRALSKALGQRPQVALLDHSGIALRAMTPEQRYQQGQMPRRIQGRRNITNAVVARNKRGLSPETKAKLAAAHRGTQMSGETRAKMAVAARKRWDDPDYRQHMVDTHNTSEYRRAVGLAQYQRLPRRADALSPYRGVSRSKGRWKAMISFQRQRFYLGYFTTQEEAAHAYDRKARELYGDQARLNFPDDTQDLSHWDAINDLTEVL